MRVAILLYSLFFVVTSVKGQGIDFFHGTWKEALEQAQKEDKIIFVDGYADWCGPCKRLAKSIFPLEEVGTFFNTNFVNVKMDMERGEGKSFRKKYPLSAFPTLFFIAPDGELIQSNRGAPRTAQALLQIAHQATSKFDRSATYLEKYEKGDRSYDNTYGLIKSLNASGKPSLRYTNEFLREQEDLGTEDNLRFIYQGLTQVDSRVFDEFVKYQSKIEQLYSAEEIEERVRNAAEQTVFNAVEFEFPALLNEAQQKYASLYPASSESFNVETNMLYAIETKDPDLLLKSYDSKRLDVEQKRALINTTLTHFGDNEKVVQATEKWAKEVVSKDKSAGSYYLLAMTQVKQEKVKQAAKSLEKCIEKTDPNSREMKIYMEQLEKLNSGS